MHMRRCFLSDLIYLIGGGTPKTTEPEYWNGDIPWLSVKDFNNVNRYVYSTEKSITEKGLNNSSTKMLEKNDIIISARGTVGEIAMLSCPMAFNQSCYGIKGKEGINQTFLYYLIKNYINKLKMLTHGSVFDTITMSTFANIEVLVPDIDSQEKISTLLAQIDDKIEINNKINNNLPPHLCVARIAATQLRQTPKTNGCLNTDDKVSDRGGNKKIPQVFSSRRAA